MKGLCHMIVIYGYMKIKKKKKLFHDIVYMYLF